MDTQLLILIHGLLGIIIAIIIIAIIETLTGKRGIGLKMVYPEKVKMRKIRVYAVSGNLVKTFKAVYDIRNNIAKLKGAEVFIDPKHLIFINGRLSVFVDIDKKTSIPPPFAEASLSSKKQEIASTILAWYYSLTGIRRREKTEILAYVIVIVALIIVFAMYYIYTVKIADVLTTLKTVIEQMAQQPPPPLSSSPG